MSNNKTIQKYLNKLISEEWFAGNMYLLFKETVKGDGTLALTEELQDIGKDELEDHYASLIGFAKQYGYKIPTCYKEFMKYAGDKDSKAFNSFKADQNPKYYLKKAIESEQRAIASYQEAYNALNKSYNVMSQEVNDFLNVLNNNFFDEIEHRDTFTFMESEFEAIY